MSADKRKACLGAFGDLIRACRLAGELSQPSLAARAGIPVASLRNWEQGRTMPNFDAACRLADALGVTLDQLRRPLADMPGPAPAPPRPGQARGQVGQVGNGKAARKRGRARK
jgi:transcriptional regulator with XRE-family HTH domain